MTDKPHYKDHRKRLRERFRKTGSKGLHDYEMLELLLTYAIPRRDVKPLAKDLIKRFGSLSGVLDANHSELEDFNGIGFTSASLIKVVKELCSNYLAEQMKRGDVLTSPQAVVDFSRAKIAGLPHEAFMVIYLNTKNEVLEYDLLQEGTIDTVAVYPRRVVESALSRHASGLILVHNHPSGNPKPSEEDRYLTRDISHAASTLDIRVLDHIIVGKNGYFSFTENKLLP